MSGVLFMSARATMGVRVAEGVYFAAGRGHDVTGPQVARLAADGAP
jgi:hypothetical protein